ncbi:MAG: twin-arginine translocation signal domain-containing protein, partial [Blastocatellia bacterium]
MTDRPITRRTVLKGGAALAGALALGGHLGVDAISPEERPTLVVFWLNGGPAGLFNSANSFLASGAFGVTEHNVRALGNGLYVDAGSLGALPASALSHMSSINFRHGVIRPHEQARAAVLESGPRSQLLRVAAAMPDAPVRCAVVNDLGFPVGLAANPAKEGTASITRVINFSDIGGPKAGRRPHEIFAAYGAPHDSTAIRDQRTTFAAVELLVRAGSNVVFAQPAYTGRADRQFDTHEDDTGVQAREVMAPIIPT